MRLPSEPSAALALLLAATSIVGVAQPTTEAVEIREAGPPGAARPVPAPAPPRCAARIAVIMITDDPYDTPEELAGQ
ncbi:MAG: hypothetical protein JNM79_25505 [Burkholderiales bacterium]|nr:hypothetical protein [Burkholderiales bacterium]